MQTLVTHFAPAPGTCDRQSDPEGTRPTFTATPPDTTTSFRRKGQLVPHQNVASLRSTIELMSGWFPEQAFLGGLGRADLAALQEAGNRVGWEQGCLVFCEGDEPDAVFFLLDGMVKIVKVSRKGYEALIELRRRGDVVGELGAVDGQLRSASVIAVTSTTALRVPAARFQRLLAARPQIANRLLLTIVGRLRVASERQLELGTVDVIGRVCKRLAELAAEAGSEADGVAVVRHVSQQDLADWAGVSRDGVVRALKELRKRGWVSTGRQRIDVMDLSSLSRRSGG